MESLLHGSVTLPLSKSESNRALMIAAYLSGTESGKWKVENCSFSVSDAHDTVLLQALLNTISIYRSAKPILLDCEDAGTVARFLLPLLCGRDGAWLLTGGERLCQRPMAPLVDALRRLGAEIAYQAKEGFLPLIIQGRPLCGGDVEIDARQSSQFVSALLMAAPMWENGLRLTIMGDMASKPYVAMTIAIMQHFGAEVQWQGQVIEVAPKPYQEVPFEVAADWSAASYWYELIALSQGGSLLLKSLRPDSLQGDAIVCKWFEQLGVRTVFGPDGATLTQESALVKEGDAPRHFDFGDTPDLFPAVFVTCVALHLPAVFTGLDNLRLKESDRVHALVAELEKLYTFININNENSININKSIFKYSNNEYNKCIILNTFNDHRIAMSLAPLKIVLSGLVLDCPEVVAKSYPNYWGEFEVVMKM